jgi:hypothetical protein
MIEIVKDAAAPAPEAMPEPRPPAAAEPAARQALWDWLATLRDSEVSRDTETWNRVTATIAQIDGFLAAKGLPL